MIDTHAWEKGEKSNVKFLNFITASFGIPKGNFLGMVGKTGLKIMVEELDSLFVAKLSFYFRIHVGMHPVIHFIAAMLSKEIISRNWSKYYYSSIAQAPYDVIAIVSIIKNENMGVTNAVKKGFANSLNGFSEKILSSSQDYSDGVNLVDVVNIIHPRHTEPLRKLIAGELPKHTPPKEAFDSKFLKNLETTLKKNPKKIINEICNIKFR